MGYNAGEWFSAGIGDAIKDIISLYSTGLMLQAPP